MAFNFPYDPNNGNPLSLQAIFLGVASANSGTPVLQVSSVNSITATTSPLSADSSSVSAKQGDAGLLHVSAFQTDAGNLMVSGKSGDAGLFRVSAIGGTTGDRTLVDGTTQTISATLTPISASPASTVAGLVINSFQFDAGKFLVSAKQGDAGVLHVSAFVDSGSVSAKSSDAGTFHVSAYAGAQNFTVSAVAPDAGTFRVSSLNQDANFMHVSGFSPDSGLFRVSAILAAGVSSVGAASFGVSAAQTDAGALHASAYSGDANQVHVSSVQGDAGLLRVSSFTMPTTNTGGASVIFVSSGASSQVSTAKSSAGRLYGYHLGNPAGVDQYLQIFNASGGAQAGTDAPVMSLYVPTLGGAVMAIGGGIGFSNGIQYIGTSTVNGQTIGASAMRINLIYG